MFNSVSPKRFRPMFNGFYGTQRSQTITEYVSGACGSKKTISACRYIKEHPETKFLYVAPTKQLIRQTAAVLKSLGVECTEIHNEISPKNVISDIVRTLKWTDDDKGNVVLITWKAYERIPYFHKRSRWTILIDELPQLDRFHELRLPVNSHLLTEHVQFISTAINGIGLLNLKSPRKTRNMLTRHRDDVTEVFRGVLDDLASGNRHVYVDSESWDRVCCRNVKGQTDASNTIYILSLLNRALFRGALLLGANIESSLVKHYLEKNCSAHFAPHEEITNALQKPNPYGDRVEIFYFLEHTNISKTFSKKYDNNGTKKIDCMDVMAFSAFANDPFLYVANNDRESPKLPGNARRIPVMCHGSNSYMSYDNIYISPSLNRKPKQFKMLQALGLTHDLVQTSTAYETYYQCVMRTSLRDPKSNRRVKIVVPDRFIANHLASLLGTTNIKKLGSIQEEPKRRPLTSSQKRQRLEHKERWQLLFGSKSVPIAAKEASVKNQGKFDGSSNSKAEHLVVTFHQTKFSSEAEHFVTESFSVQDFIQILKSESQTVIEAKELTFLFNSGVYKPPMGAEGYRRQEYFAGSSFLILDFDDGKVTPEIFEQLFGKKASIKQRRSFIIFNSFSRSPGSMPLT